MKSDVEIAREAEIRPITEIAGKLDLTADDIEMYGKYKAKISFPVWEKIKQRPDGKLILVTAINPTPAGEGKTTTSIGLADALQQLGKKTVLALREPSLGPCFGIKGGAAGGGYAQVIPMEDINLHFTGDFHAITSAHNLLAAVIDNHLQQGNALNIDVRTIAWGRVVDLNDRALRNIICGLGGRTNGVPRETGFDITVASELMAILCLATDLEDIKKRIDKIIVAYNVNKEPIYAADLKVTGALALLLKDAIKPNLVQTLEGTPAFIHGGPFANIAHGCNSLIATKYALKLADYVVTEAGFGADLGAEKFIDIKCRYGDIEPAAAVIVVTARALKIHGGVSLDKVQEENLPALKAGLVNLKKHIENMRFFNVPIVVAINKFPGDSPFELHTIEEACKYWQVPVAISSVFTDGGQGALSLAHKVISNLDGTQPLHFAYTDEQSLEEKILAIAQNIYGASDVTYSKEAAKMLAQLTDLGYGNLPICMAKTQYSLSDDPKKIGCPTDFSLHIREIRIAAGAGFVIALTGNIMTMPGLPKKPAAENMDIDNVGNIVGLF